MTDEIAPNGVDVGDGAGRVALDLERDKLDVLLRLALCGSPGRVTDNHEADNGRNREGPGEDPLAPWP
jgi:hypothetical protein